MASATKSEVDVYVQKVRKNLNSATEVRLEKRAVKLTSPLVAILLSVCGLLVIPWAKIGGQGSC